MNYASHAITEGGRGYTMYPAIALRRVCSKELVSRVNSLHRLMWHFNIHLWL